MSHEIKITHHVSYLIRTILVGLLSLLAATAWESGSVPQTATLKIHVVDASTSNGLPCRITIVDQQNAPPVISVLPGQQLAVRPGVVYTSNGQVDLSLPPGNYTIYATRGPAYSLGKQMLGVSSGSAHQVKLSLRHEVPTENLVSCDTHIHTLTHSRHGDATLDERVITLAGEGIELPIVTEHNLLADYSEAAKGLGVDSYFTPVVGVEVTTKKGHFNVFPVQMSSKAPDSTIEDWPQLMRSIRSTPGVGFIILNHPRDLHSNFRPFDPANFNAVTGENLRGTAFSFDAMEVINSSALQSDYWRLYKDWFALLNYGYRITAVGSSDSHDVSEYIVGQGRTYIVCNDKNPGQIDINEAVRNLQSGRALVSLGLLTKIKVNRQFSVGDLATKLGKTMAVEVVVNGPSWLSADRVELFANGVKIREQHLSSRSGAVEKARIKWVIPKPKHDVHLVAIATGPGKTTPYWPIHPPYQPTL
ncbi:MAG TPA: CehA/McbA family metallohydrolase, partial [Blastocatellia bacterium]|nr:CehA/McbA family metallohydrolase [Blastocatellia bacterium]